MATSTSPKQKKRVIPTQVCDEEYVYASPPESSDDEEEVDPNFVGKWMVFGSVRNPDKDGLRELDRLWFKIEGQIKTRELYNAKVSTGGPVPEHTLNDGQGVICIYTKDYRDKADVRKAAEKVREFLGPSYTKELLYKTDDVTRANVYTLYGHRGVSLYKYTIDGSFFERIDGTFHQL